MELSTDVVFPVGNMFWARSSSVKKIFDLGLTAKDFPLEEGQTNATLAHEIERSWVYIARSEGYHYQKIFNNTKYGVNIVNAMKNIAVFVHYDRDNIVSWDDLLYLERLAEIAENIIFVSNSALSEDELAKVLPLVQTVVVHENNGYDFGMWKEVLLGLFEEKKLDTYTNLILVNNSCYSPVKSLEVVFTEMGRKSVDFWGITLFPYINEGSFINKEHIDEHIQSYFMVFSKKAFSHSAFISFWNNCGLYNNMEDVVANCESVMTKTLSDAGLLYSVYIEESADLCQWLGDYSLPFRYPYQMLLAGSPLLKKKYIEYAEDNEKTAVEFFMSQIL